MEQVPVYYCTECGYIGNMPGRCPQCGGEMMADNVSLPHEKDEQKYDAHLLDEEVDKTPIEQEEV